MNLMNFKKLRIIFCEWERNNIQISSNYIHCNLQNIYYKNNCTVIYGVGKCAVGVHKKPTAQARILKITAQRRNAKIHFVARTANAIFFYLRSGGLLFRLLYTIII